MLRKRTAMIRRLAMLGAALAVGAGALATTSAASAAAGPGAAARNGADSTAISGVWEGSYTCSQGLTGLDLKISGPGSGGSLTATFSFYPLATNPAVPVGIYKMRGTYYSASKIVLNATHWVLAPAGYEMVGLSGRLSGGKFRGSVLEAGCTTFSLRKPKGHPSASNVTGTWKGSYLGCGQGPTGLRLVVRRVAHSAIKLTARFNFYALASNPTVPAGSYAMTGFYFPGGVALYGSRWIDQPAGYSFVNLVGVPPRAGGKKFSGAAVSCTSFSLRRS